MRARVTDDADLVMVLMVAFHPGRRLLIDGIGAHHMTRSFGAVQAMGAIRAFRHDLESRRHNRQRHQPVGAAMFRRLPDPEMPDRPYTRERCS